MWRRDGWTGRAADRVSVSVSVSDRATRADSGRRRSPRRWTPARVRAGRRRRRRTTRRLEGRRDDRDGDVRVARGDARVCTSASSGAGAGDRGHVVRDGVARVRGRGGGRRGWRRDRGVHRPDMLGSFGVHSGVGFGLAHSASPRGASTTGSHRFVAFVGANFDPLRSRCVVGAGQGRRRARRRTSCPRR